MILILLATIISMDIMELILMAYGNKQEKICQPIQIKTRSKEEKRLSQKLNNQNLSIH
jgi:hypothetical protein